MNDNLRTMSAKQRTLTWLSWALLVFSPFLLLGIISLVIGHNVFDSYPVWSDEVDYWRTLYSWLNVGLQKGYSGMLEALPAAGTFGVRGIAPILVYGWYVKLFGLSFSSIIMCNALWISLAAAVFCAVLKPKAGVTALLSAMFMCYVPVVLYCVTSMTELFNYAIALLYLAFLLSYNQKRSPWMLALCAITCTFACLYRNAYFVLFIPLALSFSGFKFNWKLIVSLLVAAVISIACYVVTAQYRAPYIQGFLYHLLQADSPRLFIKMLLSHTKLNLQRYLHYTHMPMQDEFRTLFAGVSTLCLLGTFIRVRRTSEKKLRLRFGFSWEMLCCFLMLLMAFGMIVVLYETVDWMDYRTLSPFLWLVLAYLIVREKRVVPIIGLLGSVATVVIMLASPAVGAYSDTNRFQREELNPKITQAAQVITYDEDAKNPLTNTVRTDLQGLQVAQELHPGLGLQYGFFITETTGKSYWILTDQLKCVVDGYEPVFSEPGIKVYRLVEPYEVD